MTGLVRFLEKISDSLEMIAAMLILIAVLYTIDMIAKWISRK